MMIEHRHLRQFLAVAAERNFTRAAERLNMAQPPLSRQILQLEQEIGAPLFDRRSRPLKLTPAGWLFYEQAIQVTQRMEELRVQMKRFVSTERRRFVIGFVPSVIYARLPSVIRGFREAFPDIDLGLIEMMGLEQVGALKDGRIDVGFGRLRFDDPAVRREVLTHEGLVVALPLDHPQLDHDRPVELSAIADGTLIVYPREPRPSYADLVLSLFRDHGVEPTVVQEVLELQTAIGLVAAKAGVCIVPTSVQQLRRNDIVYRPLAQPATSPIVLSRRVGDLSPELETIISVSLQVYKS